MIRDANESHGGGAMLWACNGLLVYFFAAFWLSNPDLNESIDIWTSLGETDKVSYCYYCESSSDDNISFEYIEPVCPF